MTRFDVDWAREDPESEAEPTPVVPPDALAEVLPEVSAAIARTRPRLEDYCGASAGYVTRATELDAGQKKTAQIVLSQLLARVTLEDLREAVGLALPDAVAGERKVGGGLREVQADVSEMTALHGLTLAIELKPVHLAVGRAIWNRFGDIRTFAVNIHLKFPFAVVGGVMTLPTRERAASDSDAAWRSTTHLVERAISRFVYAGGRKTEGDATHLLEGIAVVVFDHLTGEIISDLPPAGSGLRWDEFIAQLATAYVARFGVF